MKKIIVLISGSGSNLQSIIDNINSKNIKGEIVEVISNENGAFGLTRAKNANINTFVLDHRLYKKRDMYDKALLKRLSSLNPDLIIMAGFMRILTPIIPNYFKGKILNIHPSLLPLYPGLDTHQKAINNKDKCHGVSVHYVSPVLDGGPLIAQGRIVINNDEVSTLIKRIHKVEHLIYPLVIKYICDEKIYFDIALNKIIYKDIDVKDDIIKKDYEI